MYQDIELVGGEREEVMRLEQFETLVHQGRRVDGHLRAHRPIRMVERLLWPGGSHLLASPRTEGTARCRKANALDPLSRRSNHRLRGGRVFGIDGEQRGLGAR